MGNVILGLLLLQPATLYSLKKHFESAISLFYSASLGSIGTALSTLLDRGLVAVADSVERGRSKKTYSITPQGQAAFLEWMIEPITQRDVETVALSKVFFLGLLTQGERSRVLDQIRQRQAADEAVLLGVAQQLDSMAVPAEFRDVFHFQRQVLEYGLGSHAFARGFFAELSGEVP
jgi:DNA-binding PadR family transcriptional regulator